MLLLLLRFWRLSRVWDCQWTVGGQLAISFRIAAVELLWIRDWCRLSVAGVEEAGECRSDDLTYGGCTFAPDGASNVICTSYILVSACAQY
jgi:hypothetical protein